MKHKHYLRTYCLRQAFEHIDHKYDHVLEFGVGKGITLQVIADNLKSDFNIFAFDSFYGLPKDWTDRDGNIVSYKGKQGRGFKGQFSSNGIPPQITDVHFFIGWFQDTIALKKTCVE